MPDTRADRVKAIASMLHGRVLDRDDDAITVEVPADLVGPAASAFGQAGLSAVITGQEVRQAPKRVTTMQGATIVTDELATMAFYTFKIELQAPHAARAEPPTVDNIARQVKP